MSIRTILVLYAFLVACAGGLALHFAPPEASKAALVTGPGGIALVAILIAIFVFQGIVTFIKRVFTVLVCVALAGGVGYLAVRYGGHHAADPDAPRPPGIRGIVAPFSTLANGTPASVGSIVASDEDAEGDEDAAPSPAGWIVDSISESGNNPLHVTVLLWTIAGLSVGAGVLALFAPARKRAGVGMGVDTAVDTGVDTAAPD